MSKTYEINNFNCKGCYSKDACDKIKSFKKEMRINCPCGICLIKVVCNIVCDNFSDFVHYQTNKIEVK